MPANVPRRNARAGARLPGLEGPMIEVVRARRQSIIIGDDIEITVLSTSGDSVRIGIQAPREVPVFRKEIYVETVARAEGRIRVENADDAA